MTHDRLYLEFSFIGKNKCYCCLLAVVRSCVDEVEVFWEVEQISDLGTVQIFFQDRDSALTFLLHLHKSFGEDVDLNVYGQLYMFEASYKENLNFGQFYLTGFGASPSSISHSEYLLDLPF